MTPQLFANATVTGLALSLIALAISVPYMASRILHLGLAGIYVITPYVALWGVRAGLPVPLTIALATSVAVGLSVLCELLVHAPLTDKGSSPVGQLIAALGIYILLTHAATLLWGYDPQVFQTRGVSLVRFGGLAVAGSQIVVAAGSIISMGLFYTLLLSGSMGLRLRALADDPDALSLLGVNTQRLRLYAFALSGGLSGAASLLMAWDLGFDPTQGLPILVLAIVAAIIGGIDTLFGPLIGGVALALIRTMVVAMLGSAWADGVTFVLLGIILLVRPAGVLGPRMRLESLP